jgi:hypothetical protein
MGMCASTEIGWIITDPESGTYSNYNALFDQIQEDDNGYSIPNTADHPEGGASEPLIVETHPDAPYVVFITHLALDHGDQIEPEPVSLGKLVRDFVKKLDQNAIVTYGIIETSR